MKARSAGALLACTALALVGSAVTASPASAITIEVDSPATLVNAFAFAAPGDVIKLDGDVDVTPADGNVAVPINTDVTLDLNGHQLDVTAGSSLAGLRVIPTSTLLIIDTAGSGTLTAQGGPYGAGIGGGNAQGAGTIIINGGTVTAHGSSDPSSSGAGIGGGSNGGSGNITINGGTVIATGASDGAGVGGGGLSGGNPTNPIRITGGNVTATGGAGGAAGIGSAAGRGAGPVIIDGGVVTATGGGGASAAGGPGIGEAYNTAMSVSITGGSVIATGGTGADGGGAGIGARPGPAASRRTSRAAR